MDTIDPGHKPGRRQPEPHDAGQTGSYKVGRAVFLGAVAASGAALAFGKSIPSLGSLLPTGSDVGGFTIYTINGVPAFDPATYRLRVDGLVDEPREYTYAEVLKMPAVSEVRYYQCVTGWVVPRPRWQGVRLWDLVQASRPTAQASALRFFCMDNAYTESLTFDQAKPRDVLLGYGLNHKALSADQGLPLRLVVPGMYGYKYAKWVNHIQVVDKVIPGYWENNGYDVNAYIGNSNGI